MDAIVVKKIIDQSMENIVETIAFSYGEKFKNIIKDRLSNILFYVYDNIDYSRQRLENIDLLDIALEFANDITADLNINDEFKKELDNQLGILICLSRHLSNEENLMRAMLKFFPQHSLIEVDLKSKLNELIKRYNDDYEVKKIDNRLMDYEYVMKSFDTKIQQIKAELLKEICHFSPEACEVNYLWNLLFCFSDSFTIIDDNEKREYQEEFYQLVGCKGNNLIELEKDAHTKGIYVNDDIFYRVKEIYDRRYNDAFIDMASKTSNINDIFKDLKDNGYFISQEAISTYLMKNKDISAAVLSGGNSNKAYFNIIIYNNSLALYSSDSTDIIIHELLHILGGTNKVISKIGLYYNDDIKYLHLEESYVNYLSKKIAEIYVGKHGAIIPCKTIKSDKCVYDVTLEYFDVVFKLYHNQLMEVHISDNMSLKDANNLLPIVEIAQSLENIMNADKEKISDVVTKEINKLKRRKSL